MKQLNKIMLIEDEQDIQTIAKLTLEKIGNFIVKCCSSGKEALIEFKAFQPQIILLDMMMPEMDGIATLKALKGLPEINETVVIFMTAKCQPSEIEKFKSLGAIDVIAKPFNPMELPQTLNKIWSQHQGGLNGN